MSSPDTYENTRPLDTRIMLPVYGSANDILKLSVTAATPALDIVTFVTPNKETFSVSAEALLRAAKALTA